MITPLDKAIELLSAMTRDERQQLRKRIVALDQFGGGSTSNVAGMDSSNETLALDAIVEVMGKLGLEHTNVSFLRARSPHLQAFRDKLPDVMRYFDKGTTDAGRTLQRNELRAVLNVAVDLLYEHLRDDLSFDVISSRTLMAHFHRVPAVMNKNFPGLVPAGLLYKLVRSRR